MSFVHPLWLLALLGLPLLALGLRAWERDRRRAATAFADPALLRLSGGARARRLRVLAGALALTAVAACVLALAQPTVAGHASEERSALMIAIDTSQSMRATDIAPTRLDAGIDAARRLLDVAPAKAEIGLVAFANGATVLVAPTRERGPVRAALASLSKRVQLGTAIGDGVLASLGALRGAGVLDPLPASAATSAGRILLLTDGANTAGTEPSVAGEHARTARVPVYAVLLGNDPGRPGQPTPAEALSALAAQTGGKYTTTTTSAELQRAFEDMGVSLRRVPSRRELAVLAAAAALALLAAAAGAAVLSRRSAVRDAPGLLEGRA
ncbi:MAG: Ca-activated chloride channel [Miltoncostaeaceae bacterium]|nr:Ca-activated chloride channel [Miltoncostaeaceae bacterium]